MARALPSNANMTWIGLTKCTLGTRPPRVHYLLLQSYSQMAAATGTAAGTAAGSGTGIKATAAAASSNSTATSSSSSGSKSNSVKRSMMAAVADPESGVEAKEVFYLEAGVVSHI
jgi:hypothetical protein